MEPREPAGDWMLKPRALVPGDRVRDRRAGEPVRPRPVRPGVAEIARFGLTPVMTEGVFARRGYVAGDARRRAAALMDAWRDPSIAAVMAARGGYGSAQLLGFLDPDVVRDAAKPFIGHSDLTALLVYLTTRCGTVCFHGPMVLNLSRGEAGIRPRFVPSLSDDSGAGRRAYLGRSRHGPGRRGLWPVARRHTHAARGVARDALRVCPSVGYVLLLDEVGEQPYRIDRMLTQLTASGVLARAAAVVCGEFPECDDPTGQPTARGVVAELLETFPGPVLFGFPTGHTAGPALTVPLGVEVRVIAGRRPRLVVTESAVA